MIVFEGVSFGYTPGLEVLSDVSLEFPSGMSLVVGPNGCGKSTLLKLAAGVEIPARGRVTVSHDFEPLAHLVDRAVIERAGRWQLVERLPPPGPARMSRLEELALGL